MEEKSWFEKNRKIIFVFAAIVLFLNLVLFLVVPTQVRIELSGLYPCYIPGQSEAQGEVELTLSATLLKSVLHDSVIAGTVCISDCPGVFEPTNFLLTRTDGRWVGGLENDAASRIVCIAASKDFSDVTVVLWQNTSQTSSGFTYDFDESSVLFLSPEAATARIAAVRFDTYFG